MLCLGVAATVFWGITSLSGPRAAKAQVGTLSSAAGDTETIIAADRLSNAFRTAARSLRPSVVTITALVERPTRRGPMMRGGVPEELRGLLPEEFFEELQQQERRNRNLDEEDYSDALPAEKIQAGVGTGVIFSDDGYILTNNHVVAQADELNVELEDGRVLDAEIVGRDEKSDVAVLKVEARNLVAASFGDSSRMQVGDWVIAVGSPFGLDQTVTAGIISATNRQTGIISGRTGGYEDFLQTDAAINPGNSGGPLVNLRGQVIGINTAINSRTGTAAGVGFAIPSNMAVQIMQDLKTRGRVVRGFIGASLQQVTAQNASQLGLPQGVNRAVRIARVEDGGPADQGNLQRGDLVTAIEGQAVRTMDQLRNRVAMTRPGTTLRFELFRDGQPRELAIKVGTLTDESIAKFYDRAEVPSLGIAVERVSEALAENWDIEGEAIVVTAIESRGLAARLGMRPGDVILEVNGKPVPTTRSLRDAISDLEELNITVQRGNRLLFLSAQSS